MKARGKVRIPRTGVMSRGGTADFDTLWNVLASSMSEIHTKNASSLSFEEIYRSAYKAVMKKQGLVLYNKVIEFERTLLRDNLRKKITDLITPLLLPNTELANAMEQENERRVVGERFLSKIRDVWEDYQLCMGMIADVLMYMDKSVVAEHRSPSLYVASMCSFRDIVLRLGLEMDSQASVASVLQSTILFLIQLEREGIIIDRPLIRHCIYMLEGLYETEEEDESTKLYITSFEPAFLDSSRDSMRLRAKSCYQQQMRLHSAKEQIIELGNQINKAAKEYLQGPQPTSNGGQAQSNGAKAPEEQKSPASLQTAAAIKWVDDVLQLKKRFDHVWENAFRKDQGMQASLTKSFSDFINVNPRSAEYLSLFFDENLKKGIKGKSEEEVDILLENGITLLRYIRDKDLFETYYKKHLSRRLLMKRSVSMDAERQMISKMKMEVGNTFTQRLESMFKDMAISEDLSSSYKDHISQSNGPDPKRIELEMSILTSTMWPMEIMGKDSASHAPCNFPKNIDLLKQSFESFYLGKHSGRKLTWQAGMGSADIRATWVRPNGKTERHDLNVSTYAMIILLLFNDLPASESLTFEEIQARTNIPTHDLIRNLQSLAVAPKTRVLKKDPMSKEVKPTDRFYFNEKFQSKFTKIKIGVVSSSGNKVETKDERSETEKKMNDERGGSVEAAIVRIMKQRKRLAHSQLVNEVISQLASRFVPNVDMIKKKIESLIDREYLERLPDVEPASYGYIA
ncbi:cullin-3, variant [Coccidioides immitis RMSCC 3703]|uniref:Cullin-3, variant n=1 Tax=Coccidioides immitis RMSCC 3703 TaxID=454286 RepID=A0A0J8QJW3_COCIT|nr:cullin-3, variant [Coccidioides immitis RMSCC 3703]